MKSGDVAWGVIFAGVLTYEVRARDDLLSLACGRYRQRYPLLTRLVIFGIAGHLAGVLPPWLDLLSAKNVLHRSVIRRVFRLQEDRPYPTRAIVDAVRNSSKSPHDPVPL